MTMFHDLIFAQSETEFFVRAFEARIAFIIENGESTALILRQGGVDQRAEAPLNLHIYFQPTSLFDTLMMLGLLAAGLGLVARSLRAVHVPGSASGDRPSS